MGWHSEEAKRAFRKYVQLVLRTMPWFRSPKTLVVLWLFLVFFSLCGSWLQHTINIWVALFVLGILALPVLVGLVSKTWFSRIDCRLTFIQERLDFLWELAADAHRLQRLGEERYANPLRLNRHEAKIYSQAGEDGIVLEIFRRVGTTNCFFVEFGIGNGSENNTVYLLRHENWSGTWMDGNENSIRGVRERFSKEIDDKRLTASQQFITPENIEDLFRSHDVPAEFDLLSLDIDGNDYWVWKAIKNFSPRVVVVEYNAIFPPGSIAVMEYEPRYSHRFGAPWETSSHWGASLSAWKILGEEKGYRLVGCNIDGVDAFFVRADLVGEKFLSPFTAETHYERPMYASQWSKHGAYRREPL